MVAVLSTEPTMRTEPTSSARMEVDGCLVGISWKAIESPNVGFHEIHTNWYRVSTPSRKTGKKAKEGKPVGEEDHETTPESPRHWNNMDIVKDSQVKHDCPSIGVLDGGEAPDP